MSPAGFNVSVPTVWQVFLSSTVRDLEKYRREVQDALHKAEFACFLSEDWVGGYDDTVARCKRKLERSNGFVLLLGHWYGSIPPASQRSITHLEFGWALDKWKGQSFPPLAVMVPKQPSTADDELRSLGEQLLKEDGRDAADHALRLKAFHDEAKGSWHTVTVFEDAQDLRENVIVTCLGWTGATPLAAARGQLGVAQSGSVASQVTEEQLGRLGRKAQFESVERALADVDDRPDVPALAFFVSGNDDAGQRAFVSRLVEATLKGYGPRGRLGGMPFQSTDLAALVAWVAQALGLPVRAMQTPAELAESVAIELKTQPLYFSLHRIALLPGGVAAFRASFWLPFYARLAELRSTQRFRHRLVAVVVDYAGDDADDNVATPPKSTEGQLDYQKLLAVPKLGDFKRSDVLTWLRELDVPDEPEGRRAELATRALQNDKLESNPVPRRVFERLKGERLWPEGGSE